MEFETSDRCQIMEYELIHGDSLCVSFMGLDITDNYNPRPVLAFEYCHRLRLSVRVCGRQHDDVIKWKHFPHYWPFVGGIHRSPVNSPHKGQ